MRRKSTFIKNSSILILLFSLVYSSSAFAQSSKKKVYEVFRPNEECPVIDGKLDEPIWQKANWQNDFVQHQPSEGKPASQKTEFAILFDEHNIYIGAKCYDTKPDSIIKRITRRDDLDGDAFVVQIDSYFDKRSAFAFGVSVSGVKEDLFISNDGNEDKSWDAVWFAKTSVDQNGWYAEIKIPLTQLRFEGGKNQTWGIQVGREIFRNDEVTIWQPASKKINGWVSQYGELRGMDNLKSRKILEILPYMVARLDSYEKEPENPFKSKGKSSFLNVGIDGKIGITNNLTMDFTLNPDFGQVEADPSEVNLSSFESFFQEKRPFFVEGKNIFSFQLALGDGSLGNENLFYSRRIGRRPHYYPDVNDNEYENVPEFTRILGAAKISGKTKSGWSIGVLESLTSDEFAVIKGVSERKEIVEPLTNFTVSRAQKDMNGGNTIIGAMFTSVNRNINDNNLNFLNKAAYSGGIDFVHKWHNKDWEINLNAYFSNVNGSTEAIINTQRSSAHNFQRTDATHLGVDSTKTNLTGTGGKFLIGKMGGKLKFLFATTWKSPQLELNDAGYMRIADNIFQLSWAGYQINEPFSIFRSFRVNFNQYSEWTFNREYKGTGGNININTQFKNFWFLGFGANINAKSLSTTELRGGPSLKQPGNKDFWIFIESNEQKKFVGDISYNHSSSNQKGDYSNNGFELGFDYKPIKSLQLRTSVGYSTNKSELQYVDSPEYGNNTDYLMAKIDQKTFYGQIRINYNITPDLSIQYWGQPFLSAGKYTRFKKITESKADTYNERFHIFNGNEIHYNQDDNTYNVMHNGTNPLYTFDNPDFNIKEFLSNMVFRWEYKPGSTLFLVWSQSRNREDTLGDFNFNKNMNQLFGKKAYNIFLVKFSYRFGR
jgi:hypothetical protein